MTWNRASLDTRRCYLAGVALNVALRVSIDYFLLETLRHPDDPRFADKAIPMRNLLVVGGLSLLVPALHLWRRREKKRYPIWTDNLYLSIFWLDMAGNSFNLYNRYLHFDLIPMLTARAPSPSSSARSLASRPKALSAPRTAFTRCWRRRSTPPTSSSARATCAAGGTRPATWPPACSARPCTLAPLSGRTRAQRNEG